VTDLRLHFDDLVRLRTRALGELLSSVHVKGEISFISDGQIFEAEKKDITCPSSMRGVGEVQERPEEYLDI